MNKKFLSTFAIVVIVFASFAFASAAMAQPVDKVRVIIGFKGPSDAALVNANGGEIRFQFKYVNAIAASLPPQAVEALQKNDKIVYVEPDYEVQAIGKPTPTPPPTPDDTIPWGVNKIGAPTVWAQGDVGAGIKVAVLDTGIDMDHPDLTVAGGTNFVTPTSTADDDNGHGTHCAGTIAALDNGKGVEGVAPKAELYAVKVLDATGSGYISSIMAGIEWSITNHMQVISMSLGGSGYIPDFEQDCKDAVNAGIVVVAAAGNSGPYPNSINYPAKFPSVIAVGATDSRNKIASFSSRGPELSVVAPGVSITSTYIGGQYASGSGTSMACPHVAGTVALMLASGTLPSAIGSTLVQSVRTKLQATATNLGTIGFDTTYGYGLINAAKAAA
jgi:subtilisin